MSIINLSDFLNGSYSGYTGSKGDNGYTGSKGDNGYTGSKGDNGYTGSKGDNGYTGSKGDNGYTGSKGDTGPQGPQGPTVYPGNGLAVSTGTEWGISKDVPSGNIVGTTDTQTLTAKTLSGVVLNGGYTEDVFVITGTTPVLSPVNGSIQIWSLNGNSTPTAGTWNNGQSITLMVDDGTAYTINWISLSINWKTDAGSAPTLNTTGYTVIALWKVDATIYGARVGDA